MVTRFGQAAGGLQGKLKNTELEIRFQNIDFLVFQAVYEALPSIAGPGSVSQTVNSIMEETGLRRPRRNRGSRYYPSQQIRQILFTDGKKTGQQYTTKRPLMPPYRVRHRFALSYKVALSEEDETARRFSSDDGAVIRVKARVSRPFQPDESRPGIAFRIDMTVTRQITGSDAQSSLREIVNSMFRSPLRRSNESMTPDNLFRLLRLDDPESGAQALYTYEMELEFVGSDPKALRVADITNAAESILRLANPDYVREAILQEEIHFIAAQVIEGAPGVLRKFEHEWGLKKLTPQVRALTRADYRTIYPPLRYYATDKADGVRALASVRDRRLYVVADRLYEFGMPEEPALLDSQEEKKHGTGSQLSPRDLALTEKITIVDAEFVLGKQDDGSDSALYVFDVIAVAGEIVAKQGFEHRVGRLAEAVGIIQLFGLDASGKPYAHFETAERKVLKEQFEAIYRTPRPYAKDGMILVEPGRPWYQTLSYKWKDEWNTTIDFLARRAPPSVLGKEPFVDLPGHELHLLFVGITPELFSSLGLQYSPGYQDLFGTRMNAGSYFPIQFQPSDVPYAYLYQHPKKQPKDWDFWVAKVDEKVIELRCTGTCIAAGGGAPRPEWQLVRVREDRARELVTKRYFGNDFRIAELTWLNYVDKFPFEQLYEGPSLDYFVRPKEGIYRAQTGFTSFVKTQLIERLAHSPSVVDLAAGKGQDLRRYLNAGVEHLFVVDQDRAALSELIRRKYSIAKQRQPGRAKKASQRTSTRVHLLVADLTDPWEQTQKRLLDLGLPPDGAKAVVINLAVHYFTGSAEVLRNLIILIGKIVQIGGLVMITTMFGDQVHKLLEENGVEPNATWDSRQDTALKYSIKRLYTGDALESVGQKIGVLLPFSDGEYYEEFLVNVEFVEKEFADRGFSALSATSFVEHLNEFRTRKPKVYSQLTPQDKEYLALYGSIILRRDK